MMVILEAVNDLMNVKKKIKVYDEDGNVKRGEDGRIVKRSVHDDAMAFLSGETGSLDAYCEICNLNAAAIKSTLKRVGPFELKKQFSLLMKARTAHE